MASRWWIGVVLGLALAVDGQADTGPTKTVVAYIAAVEQGDWEEAQSLWSAAYLDESRSLGVTYEGVPCPWDLASPVILDHLAGVRGNYDLADLGSDGKQGLVALTSSAAGGEAVHVYGLLNEDGIWRLADRVWLAGRSWPVTETRYCTIRSPLAHGPGDMACSELDRFIERCARDLGADDARLARLAAAKIPYYVVDDATVAEFTGHPTKGMANLAAGAVISSHFPHFHELAHLLVNWVLEDVPLYTHPLLQEGLACRLGGRWGRSSEVILYMGWFHLDLQLVDVGDLLTRDGFSASGTDGSYAVGALVCDLVHDRAGWAGVVGLYRFLSGDWDRLGAMSAEDVARSINRICGLAYEDPVAALATAVSARAQHRRRCGVEPGAAGLRGEGPLETQRTGGRLALRVRAGEHPCSVMLAPRATHGEADPGSWSSLFADQWPDRIWDGTRWGLVCRPESVGLYDYVSNQLVATWVSSFSSEPPLGTGEPPGLEFTVDLPGELAAAPGELRVNLD